MPDAPNAVKLERFVFDALLEAGRSLVLETQREEEFAPIKNREGNDSPQTSRQLQTEQHARWLEAHGVRIPRDAAGSVNARIEISPLTAISAADLAEIELPDAIEPGHTFSI